MADQEHMFTGVAKLLPGGYEPEHIHDPPMVYYILEVRKVVQLIFGHQRRQNASSDYHCDKKIIPLKSPIHEVQWSAQAKEAVCSKLGQQANRQGDKQVAHCKVQAKPIHACHSPILE